MVDEEQPPKSVADSSNSNTHINKKRRLSKRERKNLKKKAKLTSDATNTKSICNDTAKSSTVTANNSEPPHTQPTHEEYMQKYIPAPLPAVMTNASNSSNNDGGGDDSSTNKSLGKWFPKASVIKSSVCYSNDYLAKLAKDKNKESPAAAIQQQQQQQAEPKASLVLFYQYVSPPWNDATVSSFHNYISTIAKKHRTNIGGRIRISNEAVNATISAASTPSSDDAGGADPTFEAAQTLRHFCQDLKNFDNNNNGSSSFAKTDFKYIDGLSADRHFKELKLIPVKELVFYGIREDDCAANTSTATSGGASSSKSTSNTAANASRSKEVKGGIHLDANDYHEMLKCNDAVVIDVRNHYEAAIGRFDGQIGETEGTKDEGSAAKKKAQKNDSVVAANAGDKGEEKQQQPTSGAHYIDPKMRKSTDFTSWLAEPETKAKLEGKQVMMFCTGGIRCERASAYLNAQMGNDVKGVYQLQGGIERYLQAFPEGGFFRGKNFVFDKREAISAGNINGDGGVVRKDNNNTSSDGNKAVCANCAKPWDRYIGKRKCYTCGVPILVCDTCMSAPSIHKKKKKKKKIDGGEEDGGEKMNAVKSDDSRVVTDKVRCPLCVEENVTVPAADVDYTDNGVSVGKLRTPSFLEGGGVRGNPVEDAKADNKDKKSDNNNKTAKSVLKWGGGHATKKKDKRKYSRMPCQFGVDCVRRDCFFYHPEREKQGKKKK